MDDRWFLAVIALLALGPACTTHPASNRADAAVGPSGGTSGAGGTPATGGTTYVPDPAHPIVEVPIPTTYPFASDITAGPDGNLWFTEDVVDKVGRITPEIEAEWRRETEAAYPKIRGVVVPADIFDETMRALAAYRAAQKK